MFLHKDDKGMTVADEEDEAGDEDVEVAASGGASGQAVLQVMPCLTRVTTKKVEIQVLSRQVQRIVETI